MSLAPILAAPLLVQVHLALAMISLVSGTLVLFAKKGTAFHRKLGSIFVATMLCVAATSFWITDLRAGAFSPIHILSMVWLVTLPIAIWLRRRNNIRGHAIGMVFNYVGLVVAVAFTLAPPRIVGAALVGN